MKTKHIKKTKKPEDRWKAIRRGHIYCAPACGGGCTWEAYQKAESEAKKLAEQMGSGWKTEVWENLGWHCKVVGYGGRANIRINSYPNQKTSYTAFLSPEPSCGGRWAESGDTPQEALAIVLGQARAEFNELAQLFIHVGKARSARKISRLGTSPALTQALKSILLLE